MKNLQLNRFLIIGKANAGKTLFMLNFAEHIGYKNLTIKFRNITDEVAKDNSVSYFKKTIVGSAPNTTRCLQVINIDIPVLKGKKQVEFMDTTGLSSTIHFDQDVREGMVQTIEAMKDSSIMFHIIDSSSITAEKAIDDIDMEIYRYGKKKGNYVILANKIDLKDSAEGLQIIHNTMTDVRIIHISALKKTGFDEVKKYVSKLA